MDIQTQNQARGALGDLTEDLHSVYEDVPNIDALVGNSQLQASAYSLLDGINNYAQKVYGGLDESDAPITSTQKKQMKELAKEVTDARKMIGQTIADVSWSFPDLIVESLTDAGNLAGKVINTATESAGGIVGGILKQFSFGTWIFFILAGIVAFVVLTGRNPLSLFGGK
jgi:hypothetical protein